MCIHTYIEREREGDSRINVPGFGLRPVPATRLTPYL